MTTNNDQDQYICPGTANRLWRIEEGLSTQGEFQSYINTHNLLRKNDPSLFNALRHIELQETLAILRAREGNVQTPRELLALVQECQEPHA